MTHPFYGLTAVQLMVRIDRERRVIADARGAIAGAEAVIEKLEEALALKQCDEDATAPTAMEASL